MLALKDCRKRHTLIPGPWRRVKEPPFVTCTLVGPQLKEGRASIWPRPSGYWPTMMRIWPLPPLWTRITRASQPSTGFHGMFICLHLSNPFTGFHGMFICLHLTNPFTGFHGMFICLHLTNPFTGFHGMFICLHLTNPFTGFHGMFICLHLTRPAYLYRFSRNIPILALNHDFPISSGGVPILEDAGIFRALRFRFVLFSPVFPNPPRILHLPPVKALRCRYK